MEKKKKRKVEREQKKHFSFLEFVSPKPCKTFYYLYKQMRLLGQYHVIYDRSDAAAAHHGDGGWVFIFFVFLHFLAFVVTAAPSPPFKSCTTHSNT